MHNSASLYGNPTIHCIAALTLGEVASACLPSFNVLPSALGKIVASRRIEVGGLDKHRYTTGRRE